MKIKHSKETYKKIYSMLDKVSPVDFDCGTLCGGACCTCTFEPDDIEYTADGDENADSYMGLYLLPGEEQVYERDPESDDCDDCWLEWGSIQAEEYEFPESWSGKVHFVQCKNPPDCRRERRPIQCRTFPLAPHIDEDGEFHMILNCDELPYDCPLISDNVVYDGEIKLNDNFIQSTFDAWKLLIEDPQIYDLVKMDSDYRIEDDAQIDILL